MMKPRRCSVNVLLTKEEKHRLGEKADEIGLSEGAYVRMLILLHLQQTASPAAKGGSGD